MREKLYTIDYLSNNTITFEKWQVLAKNCFDTDYIDFINAIISAKVLFYTKIEENCYQNTILELIIHRSNIISNVDNKTKTKRKIHKSA